MSEDQRKEIANTLIDLARHIRRDTLSDFIELLNKQSNETKQRRVGANEDENLIFAMQLIFNPKID